MIVAGTLLDPNKSGGTKNCVEYARVVSKNVIHIDPREFK